MAGAADRQSKGKRPPESAAPAHVVGVSEYVELRISELSANLGRLNVATIETRAKLEEWQSLRAKLDGSG